MTLPRISQPVWRAMLALGLSNQRLTCDDLFDRNETRENEFGDLHGRCWITYQHATTGSEAHVPVPPKTEWRSWRVDLTASGRTAARQVVHYAAILGEIRFRGRVVKMLLNHGTDANGMARRNSKEAREDIVRAGLPAALPVGVDDLKVLEQWGWIQASAVSQGLRKMREASGDDIRDSDFQDMDLAAALREDPDHARVHVVQSAASGRYTDCVNI